MNDKDKLVRLTAALTTVIFLLILKITITEPFLGKLLQFLHGRIKDTAAEVGKLLIIVLQSQHLSEFPGLDDGPPLVYPGFNEHINSLCVTVLAGKDNLFPQPVITKVQ